MDKLQIITAIHKGELRTLFDFFQLTSTVAEVVDNAPNHSLRIFGATTSAKKRANAYLPPDRDLFIIDLAEFVNLVTELQANGYVTVSRSYASESAFPARLLTGDGSRMDFLFYEDYEDWLSKRILPLSTLSDLVESWQTKTPDRRKVGYSL